MELRKIGLIHTPFQEPVGMPIQSAYAKGVQGWVEVDPEFQDGLKDLEGFERIWLLYWMHRAKPYRLHVKPYLSEDMKGVFATRAPARPNPIGLSPVRLVRVRGNVLDIADVDILDGSPLLDIKPYAPRFDGFRVERSGWLDATPAEGVQADSRFSLGNGRAAEHGKTVQ